MGWVVLSSVDFVGFGLGLVLEWFWVSLWFCGLRFCGGGFWVVVCVVGLFVFLGVGWFGVGLFVILDLLLDLLF